MAARFECPEEKLVVPTIPVSESNDVFHTKVQAM